MFLILVSMILPALVFTGFRRLLLRLLGINGRFSSRTDFAVSLLGGFFLLNSAVFLYYSIFRHYSVNIYSLVASGKGFAAHYIVLATVAGFLLALAEFFLRKSLPWHIKLDAGYLVCLIVCLFLIFYIGRLKDIWFVDETNTYISTNADEDVNPLLIGQEYWFSGSDMAAYMSAGSWKCLSNMQGGFLDNVLMPLYFFTMAFVSILVGGTCSKWLGLLVNGALYLILVLIVYRFLRKKNFSILPSLFAALAVALHMNILSQWETIRMYMMFTLMLVLFFRLVEQEGGAEKIQISSPSFFSPARKQFLLLWAVTTACMLTHYHLMLLIAVFCFFYGIGMLIARRFLPLLKFACCILLSLASATLIFPAWIKNLGEGKGAYSIGSLLSPDGFVGDWLDACKNILSNVTMGHLWMGLIFLAVFILYVIRKRPGIGWWSAFLAVVFHSGLIWHTGLREGRYLWPASAVILLLFVQMCMGLAQMPLSASICRFLPIAVSIVLLLGSGLSLHIGQLAYLRMRTPEELQKIEDSADVPWVIAFDPAGYKTNGSLYDFRIPVMEKWIFLGNQEAGDAGKEISLEDSEEIRQPMQQEALDPVLAESSEIILYLERGFDLELYLAYLEGQSGQEAASCEKIANSVDMDVYRIVFG